MLFRSHDSTLGINPPRLRPGSPAGTRRDNLCCALDGDAEQRVFDPTTRLLHWLTFGLITLVFVFAFSIGLATSRASHTALLQLHRSFGVTVWALILVRLVWRQFAKFPNWPTDMPQSMRLAAKGSEYALYALLLAQPVLGLLQTNARGNRVDLFFLGQLPDRKSVV